MFLFYVLFFPAQVGEDSVEPTRTRTKPGGEASAPERTTLPNLISDMHPASRGVAAHTAGLFRSVRGAKGGFPRGSSSS